MNVHYGQARTFSLNALHPSLTCAPLHKTSFEMHLGEAGVLLTLAAHLVALCRLLLLYRRCLLGVGLDLYLLECCVPPNLLNVAAAAGWDRGAQH